MTSPYRSQAERPYYAPDFDMPAVKELKKLPRSPVMKLTTLASFLALGASVAVGVSTIEGCSSFTPKQGVQTALDVAKVACIIANAESSEAIVKSICGVVDAEVPALQTILGEQRRASRRFASFNGASGARCGGSDAGADAK